MSTITVDDLRQEIKKAAVEKQSDLLNKVKQERDEPVRTFVARLRGLANIGILFTDCTGNTCTRTVSHVEPTILLALVKGLVDVDTKAISSLR